MAGLKERQDLQRLLRERIDVLLADTMVITEEFWEWEDARRRIDLLALDKDANLVVIELKRTDDGGHMELQAIRYAAMVSTMTFEQVVQAHNKLLGYQGKAREAKEAILNFLGWDEADEERFAQLVRIVLVAPEFSKEITSAVLWLNQQGLDIQCIRMKPYALEDRVLIDVQQIIPIPEAEDYQVQVREKTTRERIAKKTKWDEEKFFKALEENAGPKAGAIARDLLVWAKPLVAYVWYGEGEKSGSYTPTVKVDQDKVHLFVVRTDGKIRVRFSELKRKSPFQDVEIRLALLERLNKISGLTLPKESIEGNPHFSLLLLEDESSFQLFKASVLWMIDLTRELVRSDLQSSN